MRAWRAGAGRRRSPAAYHPTPRPIVYWQGTERGLEFLSCRRGETRQWLAHVLRSAREDGDGWVRTPHGSKEQFALLGQHLGLLSLREEQGHRRAAHARILVHPHFRDLWRHQVLGAAFLAGRFRALLADVPGIGKTVQCIVAAEAVLRGETGHGILVVCPAGATSVWRDEIARWSETPDDFLHLKTSKNVLTRRWNVVSYDLLKQPKSKWIREKRWSIVVGDEIHSCRRHANARSSAFRSLRSEFCWGLTGTPLVNDPTDVSNILLAIRSPFAWDPENPTADDAKVFAANLSEIVLRRTDDVLTDLPARRRAVRSLPVVLDTIPTDLPSLTTHRHALSDAKAPYVAEHVLSLVDAGESVVVFSCFLSSMALLGDAIRAALGKAPLVIDGSVPQKKRGEVVEAFQRGENRVLLAQIVAGGEAITLTRSAHVVFADLDYIPARHAQAERRCHRAGQKRSVLCEYMVADDPVDRRLLDLLGGKTRIMDAVHDAFAGASVETAIRPNDLLDALRGAEPPV